MNFKDTYQKLKLIVLNMENNQEKENILNKFNRLSDDMEHYVIMSDMFPSLIIDANLPQDVINNELKSYAKMYVLDEHSSFNTEQELENAIEVKVQEALKYTYFKNKNNSDIIMANGNAFKLVYFDYEDTLSFNFSHIYTSIKGKTSNGYVIDSEVVENPTLPPYSKALRHGLKKHYVEDVCILLEKTETVHNVFTGEKNTVQETMFCPYNTNNIKYKKSIIKNGEVVNTERKNITKSPNEELSFDKLNKKSGNMEL